MGLAERLEAADDATTFGASCTTCRWYKTLPDADRTAFDEWIAAGKSVRGLYKMCVAEDLRISSTPFRDHIVNHHGRNK